MTAAINTQLLMSFAVTAAVIVAVPGPSVMFIVGRALAAGRPAAIAAAAGTTLGSTFQGILAVFGFGAVIASSPILFNAIRLGGALYLVKMGIGTLRKRAFTASASGNETSAGRGREARQGFLVGATNPKMMLFYAAILPQFVDRPRGYVTAQMLVLLAVFAVLSLVGETSWGFAGGVVRNWSANSPRRIERLVGGGGVCIILVGIVLALSHSAG